MTGRPHRAFSRTAHRGCRVWERGFFPNGGRRVLTTSSHQSISRTLDAHVVHSRPDCSAKSLRNWITKHRAYTGTAALAAGRYRLHSSWNTRWHPPLTPSATRTGSCVARLKFFPDSLCRVHYAHQNLIVPGELKPANIGDSERRAKLLISASPLLTPHLCATRLRHLPIFG